MKERDRELDDLLRLLDGTLSEQEAENIRIRLDRSASLKHEFENLRKTRKQLQDTVEESAANALDPFFTDRLMRKVNQRAVVSQQDELVNMLGRVFRPVALAGFVLSICLAVYNINLAKDYTVDTTTAESVLALPPVTSMAVFDLDLYASEIAELP